MIDTNKVIAESRPMLIEFLGDIGLHHDCAKVEWDAILQPFSDWVDRQELGNDDYFYLATRLASFICEYLIDCHSGARIVEDGKILMRMPIGYGVYRDFDPYAVAMGMVTDRNSLNQFLTELIN